MNKILHLELLTITAHLSEYLLKLLIDQLIQGTLSLHQFYLRVVCILVHSLKLVAHQLHHVSFDRLAKLDENKQDKVLADEPYDLLH